MDDSQFLKPGSLLQNGIYRIEGVLGQGGFGITYLAVHTNLDRKVAIKEFFLSKISSRDENSRTVVTSGSTSAEFVEKYKAKFLKEAKNLAHLDHPNLVRVQTAFEENDTAYYVMDFINGSNLQQLVKSQGRLSFDVALEYITQVARALDYLHSDRLNHLDIKPANIMVRNDGSVALIDFGLAKHYDSSGNQTSTTPAGISQGYAPLEQYNEGGIKDFSPATDTYALAATAYYLITGSVPPPASDLVDSELQFPADVPQSVRNVLKKGVALSRKDRYQSASEFVNALKFALSGNNDERTQIVQPHSTANNYEPPVSSLDIPDRSGANRKLLIWAIAAAVVLVAVILTLALTGGNKSDYDEPPVTAQSDSAHLESDNNADDETELAPEEITKLKPSNVETGVNVLPGQYGNNYYGRNMFDGKTYTGWAVNLSNAAYDDDMLWGPVMDVNAKKLSHIRIFNGYGKNRDIYNKNTRAAWIMIYRADNIEDIQPDTRDIIYQGPLQDRMDYQKLDISPSFDNSRPTDKIGIAFSSYVPGSFDGGGGYYIGNKYDDLVISELEFYGIPQ